MKKKLLSLLLAVCMLISLLPAVTATATETAAIPEYYYNFMRLRHGQWSDSAYQPHEVTTWNWENLSANYHNYTSDSYIYYGKSDGTTWSWQSSSANLPEFGPYFPGTSGEWAAWTIRVGAEGFYTPMLTYAGVTNGGKYNAYLAPFDAENPRDEAYYIGTFDTYRTTTEYQQKAEFSKVALGAGDYIFTMEVAADQGTVASWVSSLSLFSAEGSWISIQADSLKLDVDETATTTLTCSLGDAALSASELDSLVLVSSDRSVVSAELVTDSDGTHVKVTGLKQGNATLNLAAAKGEAKGSIFVSVKVGSGVTDTTGKTRTTYITDEKRQAARENISNYDWAKTLAQPTFSAANLYVGKEEWAWNLITSQDLPRGASTTARWDPAGNNCHFCGEDLVAFTGDFYPWKYDVINDPWKIQCPSCRRRFPSNDFGAFYEAGINDHGFFDYEYAKETASHLLTNDLHPEKGDGWGVDDGWGYVTDEDYELLLGYGTTKRRHTYISYYNHWALWYGGSIRNILSCLGNAYAYTGDIKYGRIGAIMIDRIADVYPDMYVSEYFPLMSNSDFNTARGRIVGGIWETGLAKDLCMYYDYFYPAYEDESVVEFLSAKAEQYSLGDARGAHGSANESRGGVGNDKSTSEHIRQNIEDGLLREVIDGVRVENEIYGNSGMHQATATMAAVVLDTMPETSDTLDWVLGSGGNVISDILGTINRDGQGDEAAPGYSDTWVSSYLGIVDALDSYDGYAAANLYDNVKFLKLMKTNFPLTLTRNGTAPIGDSGGVANEILNMSISRLVTAYQNSGDPEIAQYIYFLNGNKSEGIQGSIFTPAGAIADDIQAVIDTYGEYPFDESSAMTGSFGFFALRDGTYKETEEPTPINTQRDFWMYFGRTTNHGHPSALNIGIDAYGIALASDCGYPESTSGTPRTLNWDRSTIIHNTVQVNDTKQSTITQGTALHFDSDNDGRVQVMDARSLGAYSATSEYRRTLVMVDYDDEVSYGVDFFRVLGGNSHTFSFHAVSDTVAATENLNLVEQNGGTYAGESVAYGNYNETSGYDGFYDVSRAANPGRDYTVDFKIMDWREKLTEERDVHLRMTQLNSFDVNEVALAKGQPPQTNGNPPALQFVLVNRTGSNLDSLFTTIYEPYDTTPYIVSREDVSIVRTDGATPSSTDTAKAVKVTLENGRVDYIIYATNNAVEYLVDGQIPFMGFVGVVSKEDGEIVYRHISDGTKIADMTATASYTGTVSDFTKILSFDNTITVTPDQEMDLDDLIGRYIFINNKAHSYKIKSATENADGTVTFGIGDYSLIKSAGYTYDIAAGNVFEIPLTKEKEDVGLATVDGAQIRTTGVQGLRFISTIEKNIAFRNVKEFGTLLIPSDDLTDPSELVCDAVLNGHKVAKVPAKKFYKQTDSEITFTAVLINIPTNQYRRAITARAYAILEDGTAVYGDTISSRSIYQVAKLALENPDETEANKLLFQEIVNTAEDNDLELPWY